MAIYDFFVSRNNSANVATYVGHPGRLFYDDTNGLIRIANGEPGGNIVQNPALAASSITEPPAPFEGMLWFNPTTEELWAYHNGAFQGTINPATTTKLGGIIAGPGANVAPDGTLTIDTTGLPLSIGNIAIDDTTIQTANADEDLILSSNGTGNVKLVGNVKFYTTSQDYTNGDRPKFALNNDGTIHADGLDIQTYGNLSLQAPFNITLANSGFFRVPAVLAGTIAQFTGHDDTRSFVVQDNYGVDAIVNTTGGEYTFRTGRGNVNVPSAVQSGDRLGSIVAAGWASNGYAGQASGMYRIVANENFTPTARGGRLELSVVPNGTTTEQTIATVTGTGVSITGSLSVTGNILGNAVATTASFGSATITSNTSTGNIAITGSITSNVKISGANVTTNNFNKAGGNITVNGRTGQLTSLADSIAKGSAVTFRVNNSYVLSSKDVVIVNMASGASISAYAIAVTYVATGRFDVTVTNNGAGALAEAIVFNFVIINVV